MKSITISLLLFVIYTIFGVYSLTLNVSPSVVQDSNTQINIAWSGLATATQYDVVCIYSPSTTDPKYPNGYISLSNSTTWKQGLGSISFPLLNVRSDYIFRIWTPGTTQPTISITTNVTLSIAATSNVVTFQNPNEPGKAYLSMTNDTSEMRLNFVSGTDDTPMVFYGTDSSNLDNFVTGTSVTYSIDQMCGYPANSTNYFKDPGYTHDVVMTGLQPLTTYYYYYGSKADGFSSVFTFVSQSNTNTEAFVVAFGDLGANFPFVAAVETQFPSTQTVAGIYNTVKLPYRLSPFYQVSSRNAPDQANQPPAWSVLHIGDISYARGKAFVWDYFLDSIEKVSSQVPYMVSIGNHEYDYTGQPFAPSWSNYGTDSGGECGVVYQTRFHMPGDDNIPTRNLWFSYEQGPIHFTVMSAEHDFLEGSEQWNWIKQDLASVDRTRTPWLVFSGHRPLYTSSLQGTDLMRENLREAFEPLLVQYDVNLCLYGHVHTYERTCGMVNFTCASDDNLAPVHVVIGMSGNTWQVPWQGPDIASGYGHANQPDWSVFRAINYGFSRLYANTTDLFFEFVGNSRFEVHDSFHLHSKYSK
eukprot:gene616-765_t